MIGAAGRESETSTPCPPLTLAAASSTSVTWPVPGTGYGNKAFTGREWDAETGLYYYRARYYDAKLGRFVSEDPIGFKGGSNLYAYVGNSPVNAVDPFGLQSSGFDPRFARWIITQALRPTCREHCQHVLEDCYAKNLVFLAAGMVCETICVTRAPSFPMTCTVICTGGAGATAQSRNLVCYAQYKDCIAGCCP
jgi:RHS repeat-associated protein